MSIVLNWEEDHMSKKIKGKKILVTGVPCKIRTLDFFNASETGVTVK